MRMVDVTVQAYCRIVDDVSRKDDGLEISYNCERQHRIYVRPDADSRKGAQSTQCGDGAPFDGDVEASHCGKAEKGKTEGWREGAWQNPTHLGRAKELSNQII